MTRESRGEASVAERVRAEHVRAEQVRTGWLLDLYAAPGEGLVLWLLQDACGRRLRLTQPFPVTFYAAGSNERLRLLWQHLSAKPVSAKQASPDVRLSRTERRDLFSGPTAVMGIQVQDPAQQAALFSQVASIFPDLTYYDADVALPLQHAAAYGTFPLAKVRVTLGRTPCDGTVTGLEVLDAPWDIDPERPPLRVMHIEPDSDPRHQPPKALCVQAGRKSYQFSLEPSRTLLINLAAVLRRHDPDLLLTAWGDTWLLPFLLELSEKLGIPLPLNRDGGAPGTAAPIAYRPERSYQAYGQVIYRGRQVLLAGRWHIDIYNAMMYHDYGLEGILESARVTSTPVQQAARLSPGSGISAMQMVTALRQGVLVPWHKQQAELPKTAMDLIHADQGGLVYQPIVGLHRDVAEIDFVSMYPSIMAHFNISPETVAVRTSPPETIGDSHLQSDCHLVGGHLVGEMASERRSAVPELNLWVEGAPGLVPQTLRPLLEKRIALKSKIMSLPGWDPRRRTYKAMAAAHKWLLVTCFGYLGYKNARFGRIEAHQAVTAYSRECLLRAKEAAEDAGYRVLHMYVDGLWVQSTNGTNETNVANGVRQIQPLLDEIVNRTHLPIALEGIYRWVAFLPSRVDARLPVANRYFGVFQDGSIKVRGIEARRRDTPPYIARTQMAILERLAAAQDASQLHETIPGVVAFLRQQLRRLRLYQAPLEELLVTQKLSRELELYRSPSPAARAAAQLEAMGKPVRPGQPIRFLYTRGGGVHAWDCPPAPSPQSLNVDYYSELFLRACAAVLQPLGVSDEELRSWLLGGADTFARPLRLFH